MLHNCDVLIENKMFPHNNIKLSLNNKPVFVTELLQKIENKQALISAFHCMFTVSVLQLQMDALDHQSRDL